MAAQIFDQLVRTALHAQGYLTFEQAMVRSPEEAACRSERRNIDFIAFHPRKMGHDRILAVNCLTERASLDLEPDLAPARLAGFAELHDQDWAKAYRRCVADVIGSKAGFTHVTIARSITGNRTLWQDDEAARRILKNPLLLWDTHDILRFAGQAERQHDALGQSATLDQAA